MNRSLHRGAAHTPILVFTGIVGLSVVFFFIFSAGSFTKKPASPPHVADVQPVKTQPPPATPVVTPRPKPVPAPIPEERTFTSAESLLKELADRLASGNHAAAMKLAGMQAGTGPRADFLRHLISTCGWRVSSSGEVWSDAGVMAGLSRRELKLEPSSPAVPAPAGSVMVDVIRTPEKGWIVKAFRFDSALVTQASGMLKAKSVIIDPAALTDTPDPLDQARRFFGSVLAHDFKAARRLTDETIVTHEKLAGMCIVFEEGEYRIATARPVVVTAGTPDSAWAIVKIHSEKQSLDSEVGLEMQRTAGGDWRIQSIDFNKMLERYVQATRAGNVFYSPIVKSAKGGESIVLYFEFDHPELHPRALHQLDIIASLLKSDPARKMRITGHADALGSDAYNDKLSAARAKNVQTRLLELGVSATQIVTAGFGSKAPLDADRRADGTDNPEGRSRNRRTEIYLDF